MNGNHDQNELDDVCNTWLEDVLRSDARREQQDSGDATFSQAVLQSLPEQRSYDVAEVARFALSAVASAAAGIVVIENGPSLLNEFSHALAAFRFDQMVISVTPFAMLLGLALFTFRLQATDR